MPSTYTVNLGIEKPATGEQSGTWGDTTNTNFDILDQGINGAVRVTLTSAGSSGSPNALQITNGAVSDGRNKFIEFFSSGDLGGSVYVQLDPNDAEKIVFIRNSLASSRSVLLFQGTYSASRDLEIPAGVDMVVKFDGGGASSATVTDVFTKLRVTELTTPTLTATTADINGGTLDNSVIGGATPAAITGTTIVANTSLNIAGDGATVTGIKDEDNMASNSATKLATQQSIKAYVDSQVGTVDTLAEILANGNTSGSNNLIIDNGQALTSNTINETTAGSGVTIDSVLLKDDVVNATDVETSSISANDGTASATIANSTGVMTIASSVLTTTDINGGTIDNTNIGASTPGTGAFSTLSATGFAVSGSGDVTIDTDTLFVDASEDKVMFGTTYNADGGNVTIRGTYGANNTSDYRGNNALALTGSDPGTTAQGSGINLAFVPVSNRGATAVISGENTGTNKEGGTQLRFSSGAGSFPTAQRDLLLLSYDSGAIFNEGSVAAVDFRVESDSNTHTLFVDAGTNRVLFGKSSSDNANTNHVTIGGSLDTSWGASLGFENDATGGLNGFIVATDDSWGIGAGFGMGLGASGSDNFRLFFSSTQSVFNERSQDIDFRVESNNNANMLFVDAGNDHVNIGTATDLGSALNVSGDITVINASSGPTIEISSNGAGSTSSLIMHESAVSGSPEFGASVAYDGSSNIFKIGIGQDVTTERMRIERDTGNVIFNESGNDSDFRVESDTNTHALFVDAGNNNIGIGCTPVTLKSSLTLQVLGNAKLGDDNGRGLLSLGDINSTGANVGIWRGESGAYAGIGNYLNLGGYDGITFTTGASEIASQTARMTISNTGAVTINSGLTVSSTVTAQDLTLSDATPTISMTDTDSNADALIFTDGGTGTGALFISADHNDEVGGSYIQLKTDGVELATFAPSLITFNDGSRDQDFRVESNDLTHALFVDAGLNNVGVGTSVPDNRLHVIDNSNSSVRVAIFGNEDNTASTSQKVKIGFGLARDSGTVKNDAGEIMVEKAAQWDSDDANIDSNMVFRVYNNNSARNTLTLQNDGKIAVTSNQAIWSGSYGGALFLKGDNSTSDRHSELTQVDSTGAAIHNGVRVKDTEVIVNDGSQDINFRVESNNDTDAIFVDGGLDRVRLAGGHQFGTSPAANADGEFLHFNTGKTQVSSGASGLVNLFERKSVDSSCAGTVYIACENSGENVNWSYILDFFFSNGTFTTTVRADGNSQGTTTVTLSENNAAIRLTVAYAGGLGGNIEFNAGGHASLLQHT